MHREASRIDLQCYTAYLLVSGYQFNAFMTTDSKTDGTKSFSDGHTKTSKVRTAPSLLPAGSQLVGFAAPSPRALAPRARRLAQDGRLRPASRSAPLYCGAAGAGGEFPCEEGAWSLWFR